MSCGRGRGSGWLRGNRRLRGSNRSLRWRKRNGWTRRRLANGWAWRGRNLGRLCGWNNHRLRNHRRRRSRRRLRFDAARRRRGRAARLGNNRSGRRWSRGRRRHRSHHSGLHASSAGGCVFSCFIGYRLLFGFGFGFGDCAKVLAHFYRGGYFNRAGMRLFLGNAGFGQIVNDGLCLDLELASQFVDSDLVRIGHCPPGRLLFSVLV
jgi:hypothetical protein